MKGNRKMNRFKKLFKPGIIVSCQAQPHEPLYKEEGGIMVLMAKAAYEAGAVGIRANGLVDVSQIIELVDLPVIAIFKQHYDGADAFVTPTLNEIDALMTIKGVQAVAVDCTFLSRPNQEKVDDFIASVKAKYPDLVIMADIATFEEGVHAEKIGVDAVATTLFGYTEASKSLPKPNLDIVRDLVKHVSIPVIAEGGIYKEEHIKEIFECGAYAAVVGGAITRPKEIATRLVKAFEATAKSV
jgi:N-acylglucosamine-6-phosphate 2-epimerase